MCDLKRNEKYKGCNVMILMFLDKLQTTYLKKSYLERYILDKIKNNQEDLIFDFIKMFVKKDILNFHTKFETYVHSELLLLSVFDKYLYENHCFDEKSFSEEYDNLLSQIKRINKNDQISKQTLVKITTHYIYKLQEVKDWKMRLKNPTNKITIGNIEISSKTISNICLTINELNRDNLITEYFKYCDNFDSIQIII
jgi:hypothetical protein